MAEAVTLTSSIRFYNRSSQRLRKFRETVIRRHKVLQYRKNRFTREFYVTRNLPIPEAEPFPDEREEEEGEEKEEKEESDSCWTASPTRWAYKNVFASSIAFMLVFSAFVGLQNLQSSLNATLGTTSLALIYASFLLVGFVTPGLVRLLKTKYSLLFGFLCHLIYIVSNFYPEFYTLIPSSIIVGIGSGPIWAGISTHLASVAVIMAPYTTESFDNIISKFTGIFFFIFQLTQILGNLVSSLVLFPYNGDGLVESNLTADRDICNNTEAQSVSDMQSYILLSVYAIFDLLGIAVLVFVVDKLPEEYSTEKMKWKLTVYCAEPLLDLLKLLFSRNMFLLGPLSLYNGMELSFAYSSYTQNIVSDCVGVSKVGFALIVLGFFSAITSIVYGKAVKFVHRLVMGTVAAIINLFFLLFLQFYPLRPDFALVFLFAIFWGIADGVWNTLASSLVGVLFPVDQEIETGYSAFRIWMSLGFAIGFVITQVKSLSHRLWIMVAVLLFSFVFYSVLEILLVCSKRSKKTSS